MAKQSSRSITEIKNKELRKAIDNLKTGSSKEKQLIFNQALRKAHLLSPIMTHVEEVEQLKNINFYLINTNDGKTFFPSFTDIGMFHKFPLTDKVEEKPALISQTIMQYNELLNNSTSQAIGIIINPGVDNIVVPNGLIKQIVHPLKNVEEKIEISEPSVYPTRLVNKMYDWLKFNSDTQRAWLKQKTMKDSISFLFVLDDEKKDKGLLQAFCTKAMSFSQNIPVEAIFYDDEIKVKLINDSIPFFDRSIGL